MEITEAVKALSALAQDSRLEVFRLLVRAGSDGLAAGDISHHVGIPPATLSFHLNQLSQAGLVTSQRNGRSIIYSIDVERIQSLLGFLMDDCCQGRPELCSPNVGARKRRKKQRATGKVR